MLSQKTKRENITSIVPPLAVQGGRTETEKKNWFAPTNFK
jgi:hypothetical protein